MAQRSVFKPDPFCQALHRTDDPKGRVSSTLVGGLDKEEENPPQQTAEGQALVSKRRSGRFVG